MEGSAGAGHSFARSDGLLEAECTTAVASWPRSPRFCAQPNPRAEGEGANRAEEAEETSGPPAPRIPAVHIWGPVQREQAVRSGALAAASSVLLAPVNGAAGLFDRLRAVVPDAVLPSATDTAQSLRVRLSASTFLHPSWVLAKGNGKNGQYIQLNTTTYPQPRGEPIGARAHRHAEAASRIAARSPRRSQRLQRSRDPTTSY